MPIDRLVQTRITCPFGSILRGMTDSDGFGIALFARGAAPVASAGALSATCFTLVVALRFFFVAVCVACDRVLPLAACVPCRLGRIPDFRIALRRENGRRTQQDNQGQEYELQVIRSVD